MPRKEIDLRIADHSVQLPSSSPHQLAQWSILYLHPLVHLLREEQLERNKLQSTSVNIASENLFTFQRATLGPSDLKVRKHNGGTTKRWDHLYNARRPRGLEFDTHHSPSLH